MMVEHTFIFSEKDLSKPLHSQAGVSNRGFIKRIIWGKKCGNLIFTKWPLKKKANRLIQNLFS